MEKSENTVMDNNSNANGNKGCLATKIIIALLLVLTGGLLLSFNLGWLPIAYKPIFISWQMALIIWGILSIFKKHPVSGVILITIGAFFLLPVIGESFPYLLNGALLDAHSYWPVLLIVAGLLFLFKGHDDKKKKSHKHWRECNRRNRKNRQCSFGSEANYEQNADYIDKSVMFNGSEQIIFSSNFNGGDINAAFGELILDLRNVSGMTENNLLEANVMFGSIVIYIPTNCRLNLMDNSTLLGEIQDKRYSRSDSPDNDKAFTLNVKGACMFGSIEIRN